MTSTAEEVRDSIMEGLYQAFMESPGFEHPELEESPDKPDFIMTLHFSKQIFLVSVEEIHD